VVDIYGSVQDRDLGAVGRDIARIVEANRPHLPRGSFVTLSGQVETMRTSYIGLLGGLAFAIVRPRTSRAGGRGGTTSICGCRRRA
jgi:Cu/Ag efflux pump CusA